jgi:hypothetical protein
MRITVIIFIIFIIVHIGRKQILIMRTLGVRNLGRIHSTLPSAIYLPSCIAIKDDFGRLGCFFLDCTPILKLKRVGVGAKGLGGPCDLFAVNKDMIRIVFIPLFKDWLMIQIFSFAYLIFFVYLHMVHSLDGVDDGVHLISTAFSFIVLSASSGTSSAVSTSVLVLTLT